MLKKEIERMNINNNIYHDFKRIDRERVESWILADFNNKNIPKDSKGKEDLFSEFERRDKIQNKIKNSELYLWLNKSCLNEPDYKNN